jgi:hypothetical protein
MIGTTHSVCGANEYDCKQLAFVPRVPEVPGIAEGSRSSAAKPSRRCTATRVASCDITRTRRSRTRGIKLEQVVVTDCAGIPRGAWRSLSHVGISPAEHVVDHDGAQKFQFRSSHHRAFSLNLSTEASEHRT